MLGRKAGFWVAVGGTAILAHFLLELAADKIPSQGLRDLVGYIHRGPGGAES
jgi:hypothetical protein